jgi:hypothetical protein
LLLYTDLATLFTLPLREGRAQRPGEGAYDTGLREAKVGTQSAPPGRQPFATVPACPAGAVVHRLPRRCPQIPNPTPRIAAAGGGGDSWGGILRMNPACSSLTMAPAGKPARWPSARLGLVWKNEGYIWAGEFTAVGGYGTQLHIRLTVQDACSPSRRHGPALSHWSVWAD